MHNVYSLHAIYCISPTCFGAMCTIIRENYYAFYLEPDIVIKLLNVVPIAIMP